MKELIKVIAFDADDTLWSNEPFFQDIEKQYTDLLKSYGTPEDISAALFQTEMNNLKCLGYGAKAFTISMVETALRVSGRKISATDIQHIIELGKSLLKMPIELLPGVKETLKTLKKTGKYKLVVATKGDLLDQENKLERSGLAPDVILVFLPQLSGNQRRAGKLVDALGLGIPYKYAHIALLAPVGRLLGGRLEGNRQAGQPDCRRHRIILSCVKAQFVRLQSAPSLGCPPPPGPDSPAGHPSTGIRRSPRQSPGSQVHGLPAPSGPGPPPGKNLGQTGPSLCPAAGSAPSGCCHGRRPPPHSR